LDAFKLIKGWEVSDAIDQPESSKVATRMVWTKVQTNLEEREDNFEIQNFRCFDGDLQISLDDFFLVFLEMIKPAYQQPIDSVTFAKALKCLKTTWNYCILLCLS
jgi:valyl-tRNA synthetase